MNRVDRTRRSAKGVIESYASELLGRSNDPDAPQKLMAIQTIALRMGWNDLFNRLRFGSKRAPETHTESAEHKEQWWQK